MSAYSYEDPLPAGSYRLTGDVVLMASIVIEGNVTLDLNGKQIKKDTRALCGAIRVMGADASLTLTDSSEEQSGMIDTFHAGDATRLGGGVYVDGGTFVMTGGTFEMTGGHIENCSAWGEGGGVYVAEGASATLITENITGNKNQSGDPDDIVGSYEEYDPPVEPEEPETPKAPGFPLVSLLPVLTKDVTFTDVSASDWFCSDVEYVYETGLMTGTAADTFSPYAPVTRGMVMTILARRDGVRTDRYTPWYAAGCEWAKAKGVSDGTNPEAAVTRAQLAAILHRFFA